MSGTSHLGTDLGTLATSEPNWSPGHWIQRGPDDALEVVRLVATEDGDDVSGYLVVAAVSEMEWTGTPCVV